VADKVLLQEFGQTSTTPPAFYDLARCSADWRGSVGQHLAFVSPGQWALVRNKTGEIDLLEGEGPTLKRRLRVTPSPKAESASEYHHQGFGVFGYSEGRIGVYEFGVKSARTTLFDANGALIGSVPGTLQGAGDWSVDNTDISTDPTK